MHWYGICLCWSLCRVSILNFIPIRRKNQLILVELANFLAFSKNFLNYSFFLFERSGCVCGNSAGGNNGAGTCSDTCVGSSLQNCGGPLPTLANYVYTTCPTG